MFLFNTAASRLMQDCFFYFKSLCLLALLILPLAMPMAAQAYAPSVPASSNGNYDVTWVVPFHILEEKVGSGSWQNVVPDSTGIKTFANKPSGTYSYQVAYLEFWPYYHLVYSNAASTTVVAIQPPTGLSSPTNDSDGSYTVSWNSVSGAAQYQLQEKVGSGSWVTVQSTSATSKAFAGKADNTYQYRVNACSTVCSNDSSVVTTTVLHVPGTPGGINAPAIDTDGSFSISWGASSGTVSTYKLQQQINGSGSWATIQNTSALSKSFSGLSPSDYQFRVQGCNSSGCGTFTPAVTVTVGNNGGNPVAAPSPVPKPDPAGVDYGDDSAGAIAGQFRVNEAGAATYSIPIMVGAGTAGVAPEVSLNYSSQAGNGIAGRGWSIGGGSAISRCRQTLQIDNQSLPVQWNNEDRFCLDGQRLLVVSGAYGASGAVYRTEIDSFARITSHGGTTASPLYFTVERKDGSTSYYGNTSNARQAGLSGNTLTWAINQFQDSFNNPIKFTYINNSNGFALSKIYYAFGNSSSATSSSYVSFIYDTTRPDPTSGYIAGHPTVNKLRLTRVDSYNADDNNAAQLIRSYHLAYAPEPLSPRPQDASLSQLESIRECIDISAIQCMPATTFDWGQQLPIGDAVSTLARQRNHLAGTQQGVSAYTLLDFNGDGLKDVAWMVAYPAGSGLDQKFFYDRATPSGFAATPFNNGSMYYHTSDNPNQGQGYTLYPIDYNADGREDLIRFRDKTNTWELFLSTPQGDGSWRLKKMNIALPFNSLEDIVFGDINSDGLVDAIQYDDYEDTAATGSLIPAAEIHVYMLERDPNAPETSPTAYRFLPATEHPVPLPHNTSGAVDTWVYNTVQDFRIADINGDGRAEFLGTATERDNCYVEIYPPLYMPIFICELTTDLIALSFDGTSMNVDTLAENIIGTVYENSSHIPNFTQGDINGDGLLDVVYQDKDAGNSNPWMVGLNEGDLSFNHSALGAITPKARSLAITDLNADGYGDLSWHDRGADQRRISYWQPVTGGFNASLHTFWANDDSNYSYQNVDGDPALELVLLYQHQTSQKRVDIWELGTLPDGHTSIDAITNGLGAVTHIEYSPLTDTGHYHRINGIDTTTTTQTVCYPLTIPGLESCVETEVASVDANGFYAGLNDPFAGISGDTLNPESTAPILEMFGPSTLVTRVSSSAPAAHDSNHSQVDQYAESAITYVYHQAKIQAAGRGYLGFKKIQTIDEQTGVITTTEYRQDFPFIGMPIKTEVRTDTDALLSQSTSEWKLKSYSHGDFGSGAFNTAITTAETQGCRALGALQPILTKSVETTYKTVSEYNQALTVTTTPLQTVVTTNSYDDKHGNVYQNIVEHRIGGATGTLAKKQTTTNLYTNGSGWTADDAKRLGRLSQATVRHQRYVNNSGDSDITRQSNFTYKSLTAGGVLATETIEQGSNFQLETTYTYDGLGNKTKATQVASDTAGLQSGAGSRETIWTYKVGGLGRYVQTTKNDKNHTVETVVSRNKYGAPTKVTNIDGVSTQTDYTPFGKPFLAYTDNGAWQNTIYDNCTVGCPTGAAFAVTSKAAGGSESTEYFDILGRSIQTQSKGFDGSTITTQTEYDALGRVKRQSQPYYNVNERYWSHNTYDVLGRPVQVLLPHSVQAIPQTVKYDGLETITTMTAVNPSASYSDSTQAKTEKRNVLGEVIEVQDERGGKVTYKYDAQGLSLIHI